jgi:hypothetical protein
MNLVWRTAPRVGYLIDRKPEIVYFFANLKPERGSL